MLAHYIPDRQDDAGICSKDVSQECGTCSATLELTYVFQDFIASSPLARSITTEILISLVVMF